MAEDYSSRYDRYRDHYNDHDDAVDDYKAGYRDEDDVAAERLDAADYDAADAYGYEDDADLLTDEPVGDERLLTAAVDEPVSDMVDDPAVHESPAYERIRRIRRRAGGRRKNNWIPPDLRKYGPPVFWPTEESDKAPGTGME